MSRLTMDPVDALLEETCRRVEQRERWRERREHLVRDAILIGTALALTAFWVAVAAMILRSL